MIFLKNDFSNYLCTPFLSSQEHLLYKQGPISSDADNDRSFLYFFGSLAQLVQSISTYVGRVAGSDNDRSFLYFSGV
jgi:hypothetical protein